MPRDTPYSGVAAIFRSCLENGVPPRVFEDGGQRRDFVHVRDVADCNVLALGATGAGGGIAAGTLRAYNVASGTPHTVGEMASELAVSFGGGTVEPKVTGEYRLGDVRHIVASSARIADALGWSARVPLADGVRDLSEWVAPLRG
jgi:dTDP-L-rhamnose 4-epimerase